MMRAADRQRLRVADVDNHVALLGVVSAIAEPSQPAKRFTAVGNAGMPETHRGEMGEARVVVSVTVDDAEHSVFVEALETDHRGMEAKSVGSLDDLGLLNPKLRTGAVVRRIAERHYGVQTIVAAGELDDDQNTFGMFFDAGAFERLCGKRCGRPTQDHREGGAHANTVQAAHEKFASGATAANMSSRHDSLNSWDGLKAV